MLTIDTRATTDVDRYACLERYRERLRLLLNAEGAKVGRALTLPQFQTWERNTWRPRFKHICLERNSVLDGVRKLKEYAPPRSLEEADPITELKASGGSDTKWDRDFNFDAIEPRGKGITPVDPVQDFTTYTEVDASAVLTQTTARATATVLSRNTTAYLYYDFGAGHFSGDVEFVFTSQITAVPAPAAGRLGGVIGMVALCNTLGDVITWRGSLPAIHCFMYNSTDAGTAQQYYLEEGNSGGTYVDNSINLTSLGIYYPRFERDESVGTYGTIYLYIYSDSGRTTLVDTLSLTLHTAKYDFRYLETTFSADDNLGVNRTLSGYVEDLDLQDGVVRRGLLTLGCGA